MQDALNTLKIIEEHIKEDGVALLHEGRIGHITEEEANKLYLKDDCPAHMIYKKQANWLVCLKNMCHN